MACIAIVAINIVMIRTLCTARRVDILKGGVDVWVLTGGAVVWVALQVGALIALGSSGRASLFWLGFVLGGALGSLALIQAHSFPSSFVGEAWHDYLVTTLRILQYRGLLDRLLIGNKWLELIDVTLFTVREFLPLLLAALVGGFIAYKCKCAIREVCTSRSTGAPRGQG
jgi:hypothetical protein